MLISFWEVMNRVTNTGELLKMDRYDMRVFEVVNRLVKKYDIRYYPAESIADTETIDKIFQAGVDAYEELGTYCVDTGRVVRFSRSEIDAALKDLEAMPDFVMIGTGKDQVKLQRRKPYDPAIPTAIGGVAESNPPEGSEFVKLYKSIFQEEMIHGAYYGPAPHSCESHPWQMGTPWEVQAARNAVAWVREALRGVGRPGLHLIDACPTSTGTASVIMGGQDQQGLRTTDAVAIATIAELKVTFELLNKVALTLQYGCLRNPYWTSMIGGFAGGPEGAAVLCVAHALNAVLVYRVGGAGYCVVSVMMATPPVSTTRLALWSRNAAFQAISSHMNMIVGGGGLTAAGPGTEQMLWEIAASGIIYSAGGGHVIQGVRKAVLKRPTQGSGLEAMWEAEVAKAVAGLPREKVMQLFDFTLSKYEDHIKNKTSPEGCSFHEMYDPETITPRESYLQIYHKVKHELTEQGLVF